MIPMYLSLVQQEMRFLIFYSDLDYAISVLRTPDQLNTAGEYGRISNTAALAFKARIALFEGTRSKYHGYGTPAKHLNIAKECAEKVMNSGQHALFSTQQLVLMDSS